MRLFRQFWIASLSALFLAVGAVQAASTTNYTDQWVLGPGMGAAVLQQGDVLFVDVFVYDSDRSPTWFTAAAYLQADSPAWNSPDFPDSSLRCIGLRIAVRIPLG